MSELPDFETLIIVAIAFIIGYCVLSFIIYVLRRGRKQESKYVGGAETHSHGSSRDAGDGGTANGSGVKDEAFYGSVLGLSHNYTLDDIRSGYLKLAAQYHPDKVDHLGPKLKSVAEQEMKQINEAYLFFRNKYKF